jgi:hypothetical protein
MTNKPTALVRIEYEKAAEAYLRSLLDGWVRFWLDGTLLPLPAQLQQELNAARREADEQRRRADGQQRRAEKAESELAALRAELERLREQR